MQALGLSGPHTYPGEEGKRFLGAGLSRETEAHPGMGAWAAESRVGSGWEAGT